MLTYADESFDTMLEIGFGTAIRREWEWRVKRGESLANLQAFAHLFPPSAPTRRLLNGKDRCDGRDSRFSLVP